MSYLLRCLCLLGFCGIHRLYTGGLLLVGRRIDLFPVPGMVADLNRRVALDMRRVTEDR